MSAHGAAAIIESRVWHAGELVAHDFPLSEIPTHLQRPDALVWVDLVHPTKELLDELADVLGVHELAVEDALGEHQRPKLDIYGSHAFLACHAAHLGQGATLLHETEIDAFIHECWLITIRHDDGFSMTPVVKRWERSPQLLRHGVPFLLYGLLDVVIDGYFDVVQQFDDYYDDVSEGLFADQPLSPGQQQDWFKMRRALVCFHRLVVPMRETVSALMRRDDTRVSDTLYPYFQDVYDHVLRVGEATDSLRDLVSTIVETNISLRDYRQNQVMKRVSSWAAIIAMPTLVTGWYGQNLPVAGAHQPWGVMASTTLVFGGSGALYLLFKRRGWL